MRALFVGFSALVVVVALFPMPASAAPSGASASIDQCTNGPVGPPLSAQPCIGSNISAVSVAISGINSGASTSYKNWVNGNSNGSKSHWREGEFISYRTIINGLGAGPHTIVFTYDTVHSGGHAEDYIASYDATETTSSVPTSASGQIIHANNNSPCQDLVLAGQMPSSQCGSAYNASGVQTSPATPIATTATPAENFGSGPGGEQGCGGAGGSFSGTQQTGTLDLYGPTGSTIGPAIILTDNAPSGTGSCTTAVSLSFSVPAAMTASQAIVITWGGHIASRKDWGVGNSASSISGSPYHESLVSLDGASTGSQDRALATSAIFFTPTISTCIDGTNPCTTSINVGSPVFDTATLSGAATNAGGTVTYSFFTGNLLCSGTAATQVVTVNNAVVPNSATKTLTAGQYSYNATYSGDGTDIGPVTSLCEPLTVGKVPTATATAVFDAATNAAWSGTEKVGASAYDTATVSGQQDGIVPTGTVTYTFFANNTCSGTGTGAGTVTLTATAAVPNSNTEGPLAAGSYSFQATYSGDSNYSGSTGACEPFSVAKGTSSTSTAVFDAATNAAWSGTEATGASAYDTATVTTSNGFTATGTVTYTFFSNGICSGTGTGAGTVTLTASGSVPKSNTAGPLAAGSYSFRATYSGDGNYSGSTGACEPFNVAKGTSSTATVVFDAATNATWSGTETTGSSAYDTATVTPSNGFTATGTVTYTFFSNGICSGTGTGAGTVTLTVSGSVPKSNTEGPLANGNYSFQAVYSGDNNYAGSTGACEPFAVGPGTSTTATAVFDAATNAPWSGAETTGASAYDTATVAPSDGFVATGTVTYTFFTNGICSGTGVSAGTETLDASGKVPHSMAEGPLKAGSYSFQATYSGDANYAGSTGACEPFAVKPGSSQTATAVFDAATNAAWAGTETTGAAAYDTAAVTTSDGFVATGSVTYNFFSNSTCSGAGTLAGTVTLTATGAVPNSSTEGPLMAGSYSFLAVYSGDSNYGGSTGPCEPFAVKPGSSQTATIVFDAATNAAWSGTETTGASAYDTATVTPSDGFVASGTVTYTFYSNSTCSGTGTGAGVVTLNAIGAVPNSNTEGPLAAGAYSFQAVYSGDGNYAGSTGACEPFSVAKGTSSTATVVFDALTNAPWSGTETTGASAYDTATGVASSVAFTPTGTVTYTFFGNGTCSGTGTLAGGGALSITGAAPNSATEGPLAAGSYSFQATYSGDGNYAGSTGACEPFTVNIGSSSTKTVVFDATTNAPWAGSETTGASAYDTATVTTSDGFVATGTVTYTFFTNIGCTGSGTSAGTVTLTAAGAVPNSSTEGPLMAGSYSFQASYSGDSNYAGSTGACEPFTVNIGSSQTATTVFDAATNAPWSGTETTGASAYDTASVSTSDGFVATGTVTYTFYGNGSCTGSGTSAGTVTLTASGAVPNSSTEGPLQAGSYSFQAVYSGDNNYAGSTGACEPFTVNIGSSQTATTVFDAATNAPWSGTETTGASAYDTAAVTPSDGFTATGTVTYTFFNNGACSGTGTSAGMVTLTATGAVPNSNTEGPLAAGSYSFQASYSGDNNYAGSTGACEPFTVNIGSSSTKTVVFDATTNGPWSGTETTGASAYDTSTITASSPAFVPTGTVTYTFFGNGTCSGTGTPAGGGALSITGAAPNSATEGPLAAGSYSFQATYSGDGNYAGSTGACEPFTVNIGSSSTKTVVFDATTNAPWAGSETTGASAYDTATVTTSDGFVATGTVTYTFFTNIGCTGSGTSAGTVTLTAAGAVPNSSTEGPLMAGSYSFQASYSGDSNYAGSTGACEPFTVNIGSSQTATTVFDAATNAPWSGTETTGASAYDTATVTTSDGFVAAGTVTYTFFTNIGCTGTGTSAGTVALTAGGAVPNSSTEGPLQAGSYSFQAVYSGDNNYAGSTGACEPFTVNIGSSQTATTVFDAATNAPWSGTETTGASAYDTAAVTPSDGFTATGTVTYAFFNNGACSGTGTSAGTVTLTAAGAVPNSSIEGPLAAGMYTFQASYSGDANYAGSTGPCEPFTVGKGSSNTVTTVVQNGTTTGASAYDTATVTTSDTIVATGTVTYNFFNNISCSAPGNSAGTVTLTATGAVPNSNVEGPPLAAGMYSFQASYSGDANYIGSTGACEPFTILPGNSTTATAVVQNGTTTGASAYDTATVTTTDTIVATGTVSYTFFNNGSCSGAGTSAGTVTLTASGSVPNSNSEGPLGAGSYSFQASYSGDSNYGGSTGPCEPFTVNKANSNTATSVFDETTNSSVPLNGTIGQGDTVHDTATVGTQIGSFVISGTVTYNFFLNNTCTAPAASSQTVTISGGKVPNSASNGPIASGAYSYQAVYSGDNNYNGSTSGCEPFAVTHVSQITPTQTTCSQFSGGTASTLTDVFYNTSGTAISNDNPGVLFYWVQVHASSAGAQTFTITQSTTYNPTTGARFFSVAAGSFAYDSSCNALSTTLSTSVSGGVQSLTVKFNAPAAGTYVIGIKYSPKSIVGSGPASTSHGPNYVYTFATTGVVGSTSTVNLTHS